MRRDSRGIRARIGSRCSSRSSSARFTRGLISSAASAAPEPSRSAARSATAMESFGRGHAATSGSTARLAIRSGRILGSDERPQRRKLLLDRPCLGVGALVACDFVQPVSRGGRSTRRCRSGAARVRWATIASANAFAISAARSGVSRFPLNRDEAALAHRRDLDRGEECRRRRAVAEPFGCSLCRLGRLNQARRREHAVALHAAFAQRARPEEDAVGRGQRCHDQTRFRLVALRGGVRVRRRGAHREHDERGDEQPVLAQRLDVAGDASALAAERQRRVGRSAPGRGQVLRARRGQSAHDSALGGDYPAARRASARALRMSSSPGKSSFATAS